MISRYSRPEMASLWTDRARYGVWLEVELEVCRHYAVRGVIPRRDWKALHSAIQKLIAAGGVDPKRVDFHERKTRHDVISFTTAVAERIGPLSRYVHFGLTSSDVVDTALSITLQRAGLILLHDLDQVLKQLKRRAVETKKLATIGRSHGIFAEPTSFGLKFLSWHCEFTRNRKRLIDALDSTRFGKLSGAVGASAHLHPDEEQKILSRLDLKREPVSTQVIPRDRHAHLLQVLALCGASMERIAVELRHLQRSEVEEVMEGFQRGQKGSSAMPHKRNPISSENLTGCARLLRAYAQAGLENVALWHERDISHSSVERVALADSMILADYSFHRLANVLDQLVIRKDRVARNLKAAGSTVYSGHVLLELVRAGVTREHAYRWVQECALRSLENEGDFIDLLTKHAEVKKYLTPAKIKKCGSIDHQLRNVAKIFTDALKKI